MRDPLVTVGPSTTLREAARLLREHQLGGLAVVEEGKLAGVITTADMLAPSPPRNQQLGIIN
jgi:CBS domain-containing protein